MAATKPEQRITTAEAVEHLRAAPEHTDLIRDSYLGENTREAAEQFERSGEFQQVKALLGDHLSGEVLDLGAGTGIASFALARAGASRVYALEPDPSPVVGRGALSRLAIERVEVLDGFGEDIPLPDESVDAVFVRQVLHHIRDLEAVAREVRRVLRPGGFFLVCREHVVNNEEELATFLSTHAVHQLTGGEGAYPIDTYLEAMKRGGLRIRRVWRPLDTVINAFPLVRSDEELHELRRAVLGPRLARFGRLAESLPGLSGLVRRQLAPYEPPGSMWSFLAERPPR